MVSEDNTTGEISSELESEGISILSRRDIRLIELGDGQSSVEYLVVILVLLCTSLHIAVRINVGLYFFNLGLLLALHLDIDKSGRISLR